MVREEDWRLTLLRCRIASVPPEDEVTTEDQLYKSAKDIEEVFTQVYPSDHALSQLFNPKSTTATYGVHAVTMRYLQEWYQTFSSIRFVLPVTTVSGFQPLPTAPVAVIESTFAQSALARVDERSMLTCSGFPRDSTVFVAPSGLFVVAVFMDPPIGGRATGEMKRTLRLVQMIKGREPTTAIHVLDVPREVELGEVTSAAVDDHLGVVYLLTAGGRVFRLPYV
jgi:hypothetical protein